MNTLIRNGRVIDPTNGVDEVADVYITDGKIAALRTTPPGFNADVTLDAIDQIVAPGFIDLCVRLREPGFEHKGNIETESAAAARAGVTTVCCPPDSNPVIDSPGVIEHIQERAQSVGKTKVLTIAALTQGLGSKQITEMAALKQAGCVAVSNLYKPLSCDISRRAMEYAASQNLPVFLFAQDSSLSKGGCAHEGTVSTRLGLPAIPESAETIAVARDLQLIALSGVRSHFCHLSSAKSVQMIARAQYEDLPITCSVTTNHLFLTEMDIGFFNSQCHVKPPLRTQRDMQGLRLGLQRGTIAAVCSDHQPHDIDAKLAPFPNSESGIAGIELLLPLMLRLVSEHVLTLPQAIANLTQRPAQIIGVDRGHLGVGAAADICIFDLKREWQVSEASITSFGKNNPYMGWEMQGHVSYTLLDGEVVYAVH